VVGGNAVRLCRGQIVAPHASFHEHTFMKIKSACEAPPKRLQGNELHLNVLNQSRFSGSLECNMFGVSLTEEE
jgi:hypothetical protein